jgi:hypothetical protein
LLVIVFLVFAADSAAPADLDRPGDGEEPTRVSVSIFVLDVDQINTAEQNFTANVYFTASWSDPRLAHEGRAAVSRPLGSVWNPGLQPINRQRTLNTLPEVVEVSPDGRVLYRQRLWGDFSQPLDLRDFPFDRQTFSIQLASSAYSSDEIVLVPNPDLASGIAVELSVPDFAVLDCKAEPKIYEPLIGIGSRAGFRLVFSAERESAYHIIKILLPLILIVMMSWIVFWIDPKDGGTQIGVGATAMLTLIAFRFAMDASLPKIPYMTRMDYFILGSTILVFASLLEVVFTYHLARVERLTKARWVDRCMRLLFPISFAVLGGKALLF